MSREYSVVVLASSRARYHTGRDRSSCASVGSASCLCHHRHGLESRALGAVQARLNGESARHLVWENQDDCEDKQAFPDFPSYPKSVPGRFDPRLMQLSPEFFLTNPMGKV